MHRYGIEDEGWFEAARTGLERRGFRLRVTQRSIVIEMDGRLPRIVGDARAFLEFAERQGLKIAPAAYEAADLYGGEKSDLAGRYTASQFETPPLAPDETPPPPPIRLAPLRTFPPLTTPPPPPPPPVAEPPQAAVPGHMRVGERRGHRLADRLGQRSNDRPGLRLGERPAELERRAAAALAEEKAQLETRCMLLTAEVRKLNDALVEATNQRDLWQLSAAAAEEKLHATQAALAVFEAAKQSDKADKRFDRLRRYLARELHPDLAGENVAERALREALFKRVWGKIEELG